MDFAKLQELAIPNLTRFLCQLASSTLSLMPRYFYENKKVLYLLVYMDDIIIIICNNSMEIK